MSLYYSCCRHFIMYIYFWELLKLGCEGNMFCLIVQGQGVALL